MSINTKIWQQAAVSSIALLLSAGAEAQQGMPPARVEIAVAQQREMAPVIESPGTVVSLNDARIAAEVEGVLTWIAQVGDAVDKGAVIARIDPRLIQVEVERASASVAGLEAELAFRENQLTRSQNLAASNNVSATLLDEARTNRDQALYQLADAKVRLARAESDLARTRIRAPFAGHVTTRLAAVGEYINVGEDVARLVDTFQREISVPAPLALTRYLAAGQSLSVRSENDARELKVRAVVPVGDAVSRMVEVRVEVGDSGWLVGTPVSVSLPSAPPATTVAVPRDALIERAGQRYIYVVGEDGTARQVNARIASSVGLWLGIASGIEAGDRVIVRGAERLAPGQPVEIIGSSSAAGVQKAGQ